MENLQDRITIIDNHDSNPEMSDKLPSYFEATGVQDEQSWPSQEIPRRRLQASGAGSIVDNRSNYEKSHPAESIPRRGLSRATERKLEQFQTLIRTNIEDALERLVEKEAENGKLVIVPANHVGSGATLCSDDYKDEDEVREIIRIDTTKTFDSEDRVVDFWRNEDIAHILADRIFEGETSEFEMQEKGSRIHGQREKSSSYIPRWNVKVSSSSEDTVFRNISDLGLYETVRGFAIIVTVRLEEVS